MKYLIFGKDGWLAGKFKEKLGNDAEISLVDIGDVQAIERELEEKRPEVIINAAGKTGRPNIDWCESHMDETLASNVLGPKNVITAIIDSLPPEEWPFLVHLGSGCIYQGEGPDGQGFKETEQPTPESFYSKTKWLAEQHILSVYVHRSLILRLRLPLDSSLNPRNLLMKLIKYNKIITDKNSVSVLPDFMDAAVKLIEAKKTGIYHIVNPGAISPAQIMHKYQEIVDSDFKFTETTCKELETQAPRSNCLLNTDRLREAGIVLRPIEDRLIEILSEFKKNLIKEVS